MTASPIRKRRSPEVARKEILDAAEVILLTAGPSALKVQRIAEQAGLSFSNVHHHFGGIADVQQALMDRMLQRLMDDLKAVITSSDGDQKSRLHDAIHTVYEVIASERYSKLVAWIVLSSETSQLVSFGEPLKSIEAILTATLATRMPIESALAAAPAIIYRIAITAIGEGLVGPMLKPVLGRHAAERFNQCVALTV